MFAHDPSLTRQVERFASALQRPHELGCSHLPLALALFARADAQLRAALANDGFIRDIAVRNQVWNDQERAKELLGMTAAQVRGVMREAAGGLDPLTVCLGKREREASHETFRLLQGDGCGRVHPDSKRGLYKRYCDICSARGCEDDRQKAFEADIRALAGDRARGIWMNHDVVGWFYRGACACGREFLALRPDQRVCEPCRKAHRVRTL